MQKKRIACFVWLLSVFAMGVTAPAKASEKPNVVIFLMDDLDFSGMGTGYDLMEFPSTERLSGDDPEFPLVVTPNIDELVGKGLIFAGLHSLSLFPAYRKIRIHRAQPQQRLRARTDGSQHYLEHACQAGAIQPSENAKICRIPDRRCRENALRRWLQEDACDLSEIHK